jgi:hypothetical protein
MTHRAACNTAASDAVLQGSLAAPAACIMNGDTGEALLPVLELIHVEYIYDQTCPSHNFYFQQAKIINHIPSLPSINEKKLCTNTPYCFLSLHFFQVQNSLIGLISSWLAQDKLLVVAAAPHASS